MVEVPSDVVLCVSKETHEIWEVGWMSVWR